MKKLVVLSVLVLMCLGTWAQGVQKLSRDIRQLINQTTLQEHRAQGEKQHETVRERASGS